MSSGSGRGERLTFAETAILDGCQGGGQPIEVFMDTLVKKRHHQLNPEIFSYPVYQVELGEIVDVFHFTMVIGLDTAFFKIDTWREDVIDLLRTTLTAIRQDIAVG